MSIKHQLLTIVAGCMALCAFTTANAQNHNAVMSNQSKKTLVAYFSATGTTMEAATQLAKAANADLHEIIPAVRYTPADLNWRDKKSRSTLEMEDKSSRPAIANRVENMEQYDTVFVGMTLRARPSCRSLRQEVVALARQCVISSLPPLGLTGSTPRI